MRTWNPEGAQTYRARRVLRADRRGSSWPLLIDTDAGVLRVDVPDAELAARLDGWAAPEGPRAGVLSRYRAQVGSAADGAVLRA